MAYMECLGILYITSGRMESHAPVASDGWQPRARWMAAPESDPDATSLGLPRVPASGVWLDRQSALAVP